MTVQFSPLEAIRHAAVNRLCVELDYNGSRRIIEPYALRVTREGDLLLYARRHDSDGVRTYRVDRIEDARVTGVHFSPVYAIEMTAGGPLVISPSP